MIPPFEITDYTLDKHVDTILDVIDAVKEHRLIILVGGNGTGKSLIRKQLNCRFIRKTNSNRNVVRQISMQMRTESRCEFGALSNIMHDEPTDPTSIATHHMITQALLREQFSMEQPYYLVLDEMEIGMSKESIFGILEIIKTKLPDWLENTLGVMVITHSDTVVKELIKDFDADFINLGYCEFDTDIQKWLDRDIIPTNFAWLKDWSMKLFRRIEDRSAPMKDN